MKDEIKQGKLRSADAKVREAEILKELLADEVQEEKGQLTRTQERLTTDEDHDTKVYIDGKAELLARDQRRAQATSALPKDVQLGRTDALRPDVTAGILEAAAREMAKLLAQEERKRRENQEALRLISCLG